MLPIWIEDEEDWSKCLLTDGLNFFWKIINIQQELFLYKEVRMKIATRITRMASVER